DDQEPNIIKININADMCGGGARKLARALSDFRSRDVSKGANLILNIHENNKNYCVYLNKLKFEFRPEDIVDALAKATDREAVHAC
ncbi:MAG: hypothetical protein IJ576_01305, partial [Synergistaceae bacterium]|nr:hypothetical protein [Synergistaceae bacterium]